MTESLKILVMGTTDHAEVVIDTHETSISGEFVGFLENQTREKTRASKMGLPVYWSDDATGLSQTHKLVCALATTERSIWIRQLEERGFTFAQLVHKTSVVSKRTILDRGLILDPLTVVAAFTEIGPHVRIGRGASIGHHARIGPFSTIHPGAIVLGNCKIGARVMIGSGATIKNGLSIGDGATISLGAVVTKDVPAGGIVRGNPSREIARKYTK